MICGLVLGDTEQICATDVSVFKRTIEDIEILELHSNGQRGVIRDGEGKIKPEGFRYVAYYTFLQICSLRFSGKGRRHVLPSCVVRKIRELFRTFSERQLYGLSTRHGEFKDLNKPKIV